MEHILTETGIRPILIENALHWRYATKLFDEHEKIPEDRFELLMESLRLSPSSIGLQPWKFVIVKKKAIRKQLFHLSLQQSQMVDASHLILLCSLKTINASYISKLIELDKQENECNSHLEDFKAYAMSFIESRSKEELKEWMTQQVYIALGFLLCTCAMLHIDACPMEAFDYSKANKLLNLSKYGVESRIAVAIGYRSDKDEYAKRRKLRWESEDVFIRL